jgi:hypothetical protein
LSGFPWAALASMEGDVMRRSWWLTTVTTVPVTVLALATVAPRAGAASAPQARHVSAASVSPVTQASRVTTGSQAGDPFCARLGKQYQASSAAQSFCFGPQFHKGTQGPPAIAEGPSAGPNVDAATIAEDVSPAGVPAQGQSEVSIAAAGPYVVEAWNDGTGFLTACPAPMSKEELTGLGFSTDGGKSFTDLGGLPNANCSKLTYFGDPSVAAYRVGGHTFFYISSLYLPTRFFGRTHAALDACEVVGSGSAATLSCGQPVIVASSSQCRLFKIRISPTQTRIVRFCSFVDKDFLAIDPAHGKLYLTYSDFLVTRPFGDTIDMSACDIGNAAGGAGPAGGTPAAPVCKTGTRLVKVSKHLLLAKPYLRVAKENSLGCLNEGAYPAVDTRTGAAYVGFEFNWASSLFFPPCLSASTPVQDVIGKVPARCLTLTKVSPCKGPSARAAVPVVSMEAVFVPGYLRFPANDFPRLAVSDKFGTVTMVWNDARFHPFGDILMQSFHKNSLKPVQAKPVTLDQPHNAGLSFLPALRSATRSGLLDVTWYTRASVTTANTNVAAALGVSPLATMTPPNVRITDVASNWLVNSSLIIPNFGDYTDNAVSVTARPPFVGSRLFVAWADGRVGIPQPFEAHMPSG